MARDGDRDASMTGPPPPLPKRKNSVLRLFDAPLYRDWLVWFTAVWVAIGISSMLTTTQPLPAPRWSYTMLSAFVFLVLAGVIPGWARLLIRRHLWNRRQSEQTPSHKPTTARAAAARRYGQQGHSKAREPRSAENEPQTPSDPPAETATGLGVTAANPALVGIDSEEAPSATTSTPSWSRVHWDRIDAEGFERLLTRLLSESGSYSRITRLMNVNAADAGRDIQAYRRATDGLVSERFERVIVQAKHWPKRGIGSSDIADLVHAKLPLWEGEPVRGLIVATTGSFTQDAVRWVDNHNSAAKRPDIVLWSSNELEALLRRWPTLTHEFDLVD